MTLVLGIMGFAALVITGAATGSLTEVVTPSGDDTDVALPDRDDAGSFGELGSLTPEQREALEQLDPDRLRCEPRGCEAWRLELEDERSRIAVANGFVAVIDGDVLRVRSTSVGLAGQTSRFLPARTERTSVSSVVGSGSGGSGGDQADDDDGEGATDDDNGEGEGDAPSDGDGAVRFGHDLDVSELLEELVDGEPAGAPDRMELAYDGTVVMQWEHRSVAVGRTVRWDVSPTNGPFWYLEVVGERVVAINDDRVQEGIAMDGARRPSGPVRITGYDLRDGSVVWERTSVSPRNFVDAGLIVTTTDGALELLDLDDGEPIWRRSLSPDERVQITTGPWLVVGNTSGSILLDVQTGETVATRDTSALVTPIQAMGDQWVAMWIDGALNGQSPPPIVLVALDDDGQERWRTPLSQMEGGACCPAAIPWVDDTIAVFDTGASPPAWITLDAATGQVRDLGEAAQPQPPLAVDDSRAYVAARAPGRVIQEGSDRIGLFSIAGAATVTGNSDIEVVSLDPLVVTQGRQVIGVRPVSPE